jgi:hypothetical protein
LGRSPVLRSDNVLACAEIEGGHPAATERYFDLALIGGGAILDSLSPSPYVPASRWHSLIWSANSLPD